VERRRVLAELYAKRGAVVPGLELPEEPAWAHSNWQSYCVRLPNGSDGRMVMQTLLDAGIATRGGVMCAHPEPAYAAMRNAPGPLREAEPAQDRCIMLPLFHELNDGAVAHVVQRLAAACESSRLVVSTSRS